MGATHSTFDNGVDICVSWVKASCGQVPDRAVRAGQGVFVARALHNGHFIPGKVLDGYDYCFVCYDGEEHAKSEYEVLVDTTVLDHCYVEWKYTDGNYLPKGAIIAGTDSRSPLYITRRQHEGEISVGKFQLSQGCSYIPFRGDEVKCVGAEILCCVSRYM